MFMGVMVLSIFGFGALAVDLSYIAVTNAQAQAVADAASHAALIAVRHSDAPSPAGRRADGEAAAARIVELNAVGAGGRGTLEQLAFGVYDVDDGSFDEGAWPPNAVHAEVARAGSNALDLLLAPLLGHAEADVREEGITAANPREIVVVVDRSCSMAEPRGYQGWEGVRDALAVFADYMVETQIPDDRLGATHFNSSGGVWQELTPLQGNGTAVLARWGNWGFCRTNRGWAAPGTPRGTGPGEDRFACSGATDQRDGVEPAHDMLVDSGNPMAFKAMIIVSDGNPNPASLASDFLAATEAAWDDDIHVWTVGFGNAIDRELMTEAAKGIGTYHHAPGPEGLQDVMLEIARSIPVAVVQ